MSTESVLAEVLYAQEHGQRYYCGRCKRVAYKVETRARVPGFCARCSTFRTWHRLPKPEQNR